MCKSQIDKNKEQEKSQAEIYDAVQKGDLKQVINLINAGVDLEQSDKDGYTCLK